MRIYLRNPVFYVLMVVSSYTSLSAMEPVDMPGDEAHEAIPLLDRAQEDHQEAQDIRLEMAMEDESDTELDEQKPVLFDGSRRFYDGEARKQAKIKAFKQCLKFTTLWTMLYTGLAGGSAYAINTLFPLMILLIASRDFSTIPQFPFQIMGAVTLGETALCMIIFMVYNSILAWRREFRPVIKELNPFKPCPPVTCCDEDLYSPIKPLVTIPQSMVDAADNSKLICSTKTHVLGLYHRPARVFEELHFDGLRRLLFSKKDFELFKRTKEKLENAHLNLHEEYRNLAYQVKKILRANLLKDLVKQIFRYFPQRNILKHMLAHHPQHTWDQQFCYIHEKDALSLLKKHGAQDWEKAFSKRFKPYLAASILAENGWIAFSKSKNTQFDAT